MYPECRSTEFYIRRDFSDHFESVYEESRLWYRTQEPDKRELGLNLDSMA